ncbi:hypothetical protein AB0L62_16940 [Nocardia asteroides]|uniref:hypothetical protein n=1 Tax=Nocardia asteroides TaxID=1824 RepID=UPI00341803B8
MLATARGSAIADEGTDVNRTLLVTTLLALALAGAACTSPSGPTTPTDPTTPEPTTTSRTPPPNPTSRRAGDSYDPTDPDSVCFGAKPELPQPYPGCPGYDPHQPSE